MTRQFTIRHLMPFGGYMRVRGKEDDGRDLSSTGQPKLLPRRNEHPHPSTKITHSSEDMIVLCNFCDGMYQSEVGDAERVER